MALNPFFLHGSESEQRLIQSLVNEQLSMYGMDIAYLPQRMIRKETVIREVTSSKFTDKFIVEAYLSNYGGYSGSGDILSKFGMQLKDEVTLIISKERFEDFISPLLSEIPTSENTTSLRPREGDLIWFPLGERLFEIKFVEHEQPFYQLGKTYVYELKCELFEYTHSSVISTGIGEIDESLEDYGYIKSLTLLASGSQASASATIRGNSGYVKTINLIEDGYNYTTVPTVTIDNPPAAVSAAATATVSVGGSVTGITITNSGYYPSHKNTPTVTFSDPTGGGNETNIVKFGSRSYDGENSGLLIPTPGLAERETGAIEFWLYATTAAAGDVKILEWGTNDANNIKYYLYFSTSEGATSLNWSRPISDSEDNSDTVELVSNYNNNFNRWNWIRLSQTDDISGSHRVAAHFFGDTTNSSYSTNTFNTTFMNSDGVHLNPNGNFSDNEIYLDELRFTSIGSTSQPAAAPTSTSKNYPNTLFFQDGERVTTTGNVILNSTGNVTGISLTENGVNYTSVPTISIQDAYPSITATAVAITSCIGNYCSVDNIYITNPGAGYTSIPNVIISGTSGVGATATAEIDTTYCGISSISITDAGSGYNYSPIVTFSSPDVVGVGTTAASGIANITSAGIVDSVYLTNSGVGYTSAPSITIAAPATITGIGTYIFNEVVTGESSGSTAYVKSWDTTTNILKIGNISGTFTDGEVIVGSSSSARYTIGELGENPINQDKYEQNDVIQTESSSIIDFTETNLFGNY